MTERRTALDGSDEVQPPSEAGAALAAELTGLVQDEVPRRAAATSGTPAERLAWHRVTARNGDRLRELLEEHGWPAEDLVGTAAASAAFLVAQHADRQLDVQRRALELLERVVAEGRAPARAAALLEDRVRVNAGLEQRYGTQIAEVVDGRPVPWPVAEPEALDERRVAVGLEPWSVHMARVLADGMT